MAFQIDDSVPMPGRRNRYPFESMLPGQSFQIVGEEEARKVRNAAYQFAKKVNTAANLESGSEGEVKFALRKVDETPLLGPDGAPVMETVTAKDGTEKTRPATVKTYRLWRE